MERLWSLLREIAVLPDFRPLPSDDLLYLYGLSEEEVDEEVVCRLVVELDLILPPEEVIKKVGKIGTPRDVLRLLRLTRSRSPDDEPSKTPPAP